MLTIDEFADLREGLPKFSSRPINFIFGLGAASRLLWIGFAIVYQVLFTDVSNHLPQFATLKAMGYSDGYLRRIVLEESLILSVLGFLPGAAMAWGLYAITVKATNLPLQMTTARGALIFRPDRRDVRALRDAGDAQAPAGRSGGCVLIIHVIEDGNDPAISTDVVICGSGAAGLTRWPSLPAGAWISPDREAAGRFRQRLAGSGIW